MNKENDFMEAVMTMSMEELEENTKTKETKEDKKMKKEEKTLFTVVGKDTEDGRIEVTSSISKQLIVEALELLVSYGEGETEAEMIESDSRRVKARNKTLIEVVKKLAKFLS